MAETVLKVGANEQYTTINAAIAAANTQGGNADIQVDAGTYTNDGGALFDGINNVTIEGVGGMARIVDPSYNAAGKAAVVTGGNNVVLKNLDISGVAVSDGNGAAVRYDQGSLTLINDSFHDSQNGILGAADPTGSITIENSEFYNNGVGGDGHTHNIYVGDIANFTLTASYVHDANIGHEVKSRAQNNTITNNVIADNNGTSSYSLDLPNGGNATITGNTIEQGVNGQNPYIIAFGEEGDSNPGNEVTFSNNTIVDDSGKGPLWMNDGATVTSTGNTLYNLGLNNLGSGINSGGYTEVSTRPTVSGAGVGVGSGGTSPKPDTTPPSLTVTESISGLTNLTSVTISGTVSDAQSSVTGVEVYDTSGGHQADLGAARIGSNGTWTFNAAGLANGTYQFAAAAVDAAGNGTGKLSAGNPVTVDTVAPQPVIKIITGNSDGGVTLTGVSEANSIVSVADTVGGKTTSLGSVMASSTGAWQLTSHALINASTISSFSANAVDPAGNTGTTPGKLFLTSTGSDTLTGTAGVSDVFAIMSFHGSDAINSFQAASVVGPVHDYIDFSGRGITSFGQVQQMMSGTNSAVITVGGGKTITLTNVPPTSLTASDFRYS